MFKIDRKSIEKQLRIKSYFYLIFALLVFSTNKYSLAEIKNDSQENLLNIKYLKDTPKNNYILGTGDKLRINVSNNYPELYSTVVINGEGTINLPLLDEVYIKGLTTKELKKLLNEAYLEFIKFPNLDLEIIGYRPIQIEVQGEVTNPGIHTLSGALSTNDLDASDYFDKNSSSLDTQNLNKLSYVKKNFPVNYYFPTVFDALRSSGGLTIFSDLSSIKVIRKDSISNGSGTIMTELNFSNINNSSNQNIRIYDGDIIRLKKLDSPNKNSLVNAIRTSLNPKYIYVNVVGRVNTPGLIKMSNISTLNDAISLAGGTKVLKGKTNYMTIKNDGTFESRKIRYNASNRRGSYKNPYLKDGDFIVIDDSLISASAQVINEITSPFRGIVSAYGLIKVFDD
tara:strand:- start:1802 stop:2992 length:1191 start_codon:yes stop_codon:yes gene_type:complete